MEKTIHNHLKKNEQLLWQGKPESFKMLDNTNKSSIIGNALIKAVVILGLIALCIYIDIEEAFIKPWAILFLIVFGIYIQTEPFRIAHHLRDKTQYILTDQRILRMGAKKDSVSYEDIQTASLKTDEDGHYSLLCGEDSLTMKSNQWRNYADSNVITEMDSDTCACMILYALPMDTNLKRILQAHLPLEK